MKVKICGITNLDDALLCEAEGADFLGFLFYEKSKRYIAPEVAATIINRLSSQVRKVGVFVNAEPDYINRVVHIAGLDYAQLHGDESPELMQHVEAKTIRGFRVGPEFDFSTVAAYTGAIPLFDTYTKDAYGGTGERFDWKIIPARLDGTYFLSGGLAPENISRAVAETKPFGVDLSSSLESVQGKKDHQRVKLFFSNLRACSGEAAV